jgi:hypothetical protein
MCISRAFLVATAERRRAGLMGLLVLETFDAESFPPDSGAAGWSPSTTNRWADTVQHNVVAAVRRRRDTLARGSDQERRALAAAEQTPDPSGVLFRGDAAPRGVVGHTSPGEVEAGALPCFCSPSLCPHCRGADALGRPRARHECACDRRQRSLAYRHARPHGRGYPWLRSFTLHVWLRTQACAIGQAVHPPR